MAVDDEPQQHQQRLKTLAEIPGPKGLPFIGILPLFIKYSGRTHELYEQLYRDYGRTVKMKLFGKEQILLFDPQHIKTVMLHDQTNANRGTLEPWVMHRKQAGLPQSITQTAGAEWWHIRQLVNPMLQPKNINAWVDRVNRVADGLVKEINVRGGKFSLNEILDLGAMYGLESILSIVLGVETKQLGSGAPRNEDAHELALAMRGMFDTTEHLVYSLPIWRFVKTRELKKSYEYWDTMYRITEKLAGQYESGMDSRDAFANTIHAADPEKYSARDKKMILNEIIAGGVDTTANGTAWVLAHVAFRPDVQEKIYQEVKTHAGDGPITEEKLKNLKYTKKCLSEAMRLNPIVPLNVRILTQDLVVGDYLLPKGIAVQCSVYTSGKSEEFVSQPNEFNPDRDMDRFASKTFGAGARQCPGERVARMEIELALAKLVLNFKMKAVSIPNVYSGLLLKPVDPENRKVFIEFEPRN